jgi:glyoxylase-like metal-dependent hydrolase (beta-lactamase superfamily II)
MNRRDFLARSSLALIAAACRELPLIAQQPATSFQDLRRGVGLFNGEGGTIGWLVARDGVVVVDSQMPRSAQACLEGLKQRSQRGIDVLINTHHHGDHTAGNQTFRPAVKSIVAHANCDKLYRQTSATQKNEAQQAYPDRTFTDMWSQTIGDETVSARHYGPAHTGGDVVVTFERANVVHMGDLMFNRVHPFIDRPGGASIANWIKTLDAVPAQHAADTIYIFGHGKQGLPPSGTREALANFRNYLDAALQHARRELKAGRSKEETQKSIAALPGFEDYASPIPLLSLTGVLGVAYDEAKG